MKFIAILGEGNTGKTAFFKKLTRGKKIAFVSSPNNVSSITNPEVICIEDYVKTSVVLEIMSKLLKFFQKNISVYIISNHLDKRILSEYFSEIYAGKNFNDIPSGYELKEEIPNKGYPFHRYEKL